MNCGVAEATGRRGGNCRGGPPWPPDRTQPRCPSDRAALRGRPYSYALGDRVTELPLVAVDSKYWQEYSAGHGDHGAQREGKEVCRAA